MAAAGFWPPEAWHAQLGSLPAHRPYVIMVGFATVAEGCTLLSGVETREPYQPNRPSKVLVALATLQNLNSIQEPNEIKKIPFQRLIIFRGLMKYLSISNYYYFGNDSIIHYQL